MEEEATTEYEGEEMARACSPTDREAHRGLPSWQEKEQKSAAPRVGAGRGGGAAVAATAMTSAPSPALPGKTRDSESALTAPVIMGVQQWNREAGSWLPARAASRTQPQGLLVGEKKDQEEIDGTKVPEQNIPEKKEEYNSNKRRRYKDGARVEATLEGGQDAMPDEFLSEHSNSTMDAELLEAGPSAAATAAPCVAMPPHPATSTSPPASSLPPPTPPPPPPTAATRRGPHVPQNEDEQDERIRELETQLAQTLQEAEDLKAQRQSQALLAADAADGRVAAPIPLSGVATMEGPRAIVVSLEIRPDRVKDFLAAIKIDCEGSRLEPGCLRFDVIRDLENPCKFQLYEVYRDADAEAYHREQAHFKAWANFKNNVGQPEGTAQPVISLINQKGIAIEWTS
jgi:autoinducer 2-degrading protein